MGSEISAPPVPRRFYDVLVQGLPAYGARFGATLPARQRQVLQRILDCRTAVRGGRLFRCPECRLIHFAYHSCNDRHCPQCGHTDADQWLAAQSSRLLPVDYFLVTFTVPEGVRGWMRHQPLLGYHALFTASSRALLELAAHPQRLGVQLGMWGVLHTWTRTLVYHPHIHYLVPAGGLSLDGQQWVAAPSEFLVRVEPLSDHFRTCFRRWLEQHAPKVLATIAPKVWQQRWITHCQAAGSGQFALRYLSRYVFQTATGNRRLAELPDGRVVWTYRESRTRQWRSLPLKKQELIRRFLQHVLPAGYHRIRRFGWLHPAAKARREKVEQLVGRAAESFRARENDPPLDATDDLEPDSSQATEDSAPDQSGEAPATSGAPPARSVCPRCGTAMVCLGRLPRVLAGRPFFPARPPPDSS